MAINRGSASGADAQDAHARSRVAWHLDHAEHCSCRKLDGMIHDEIIRRGLPVPR